MLGIGTHECTCFQMFALRALAGDESWVDLRRFERLCSV
jgi:hypothetical protein